MRCTDIFTLLTLVCRVLFVPVYRSNAFLFVLFTLASHVGDFFHLSTPVMIFWLDCYVFFIRKYLWIETYRRQCKMSSSKKNWPVKCKEIGAAGVYLSEVQNPIPFSTYTLYTCIQYTYSHREKGWGGEGWTREMVRWATVHKAGSKMPTLLTVPPLYKPW